MWAVNFTLDRNRKNQRMALYCMYSIDESSLCPVNISIVPVAAANFRVRKKAPRRCSTARWITSWHRTQRASSLWTARPPVCIRTRATTLPQLASGPWASDSLASRLFREAHCTRRSSAVCTVPNTGLYCALNRFCSLSVWFHCIVLYCTVRNLWSRLKFSSFYNAPFPFSCCLIRIDGGLK